MMNHGVSRNLPTVEEEQLAELFKFRRDRNGRVANGTANFGRRCAAA
jgi:hypothetical protein